MSIRNEIIDFSPSPVSDAPNLSKTVGPFSGGWPINNNNIVNVISLLSSSPADH